MKKYCEEVDAVYKIIDPGYQKERGTILRVLCETSKMLAKGYLHDKKETDDQFTERAIKAIEIFKESQKCMMVRLKNKKGLNEFSEFNLGKLGFANIWL